MPTQLSTTPSRLFKPKPKRAGTTRRIVFVALSRAGITHVCVGFDGESDQGQVRATASADGKGVGFPPLVLTLHISKFGSTELTSREFRLQDAYSPVSPAFPAWLQFWLHIRMPSSAFSIGDFAMMISSPPTIHIAAPPVTPEPSFGRPGATASLDRHLDRYPPRRSASSFAIAVLNSTKSDT